jgi:acyl dehydratase
MVTSWAGDPRKVELLRCRFAGMVLPGDTVTCRGRITNVTDTAIDLEVWAENQRGEQVLSKGSARVRK